MKSDVVVQKGTRIQPQHIAIMASVGAVNEAQIKQYIEDQSDDPGSFKIWDEPEPEAADLESDSPENSDDFKS